MQVRQITDTKTVTLNDAEFTIGIISRKKWIELWSKLRLFRAMLGEIESEGGKAVPQEKLYEADEKFEITFWDLIKHGVKSHKGLKDKSGDEVAFKKDKDGLLDDSVIELYHLNGLFVSLGSEVMTFNSLTEDDRKNS